MPKVITSYSYQGEEMILAFENDIVKVFLEQDAEYGIVTDKDCNALFEISTVEGDNDKIIIKLP